MAYGELRIPTGAVASTAKTDDPPGAKATRDWRCRLVEKVHGALMLRTLLNLPERILRVVDIPPSTASPCGSDISISGATIAVASPLAPFLRDDIATTIRSN